MLVNAAPVELPSPVPATLGSRPGDELEVNLGRRPGTTSQAKISQSVSSTRGEPAHRGRRPSSRQKKGLGKRPGPTSKNENSLEISSMEHTLGEPANQASRPNDRQESHLGSKPDPIFEAELKKTIDTAIFNTDELVIATRRPHHDSYFLPGKVGGRPVQCVIDTGCTINILSKHSFDRLPARLKERFEAKQSHEAMVDGTQLVFLSSQVYGVELRLKGLCLEEVFVVGRVNDNIILGMPFLSAHYCTMTLGLPVIS